MTVLCGLNKSCTQASVTFIEGNDIEIWLRERLARVKRADDPMLATLKTALEKRARPEHIAESAYGEIPQVQEDLLDQKLPLYDSAQKNGWAGFFKKFNASIHTLTHHYCHAMSAVEMSPYDRSIIIVTDAEGSSLNSFDENHPEQALIAPHLPRKKNQWVRECTSVYLQDGANVRCVEKDWEYGTKSGGRIVFQKMGLGWFYAAASEYIFNSPHEAGKVMGLAPYGRPRKMKDRVSFLEGLDRKKAFKGKNKAAWEKSKHFKIYADVAATVQKHFEDSSLALLKKVRREYPDYTNIIFVGGCALNCTLNSRLLDDGILTDLYVPPFPGDEGISLGAAAHIKYHIQKQEWQKRPPGSQTSYFGPKRSVPQGDEVGKIFLGFQIEKPQDFVEATVDLLKKGHILGWYQGRSETGPRALGNRSILADPRIPDLRNFLNEEIKMRESFRPYGCSVPFEKASLYFDVAPDFESPFMSFAPKVRKPYKKILKEVSHIDGTSRFQTVRPEQNPLFYEVLLRFGQETDLYCLLNTSLNVMGEPIVESAEDARRFLENSAVDTLIYGDWIISR